MKKVPNTKLQKELEALRIKFENEEKRNELKSFNVDDLDRLIDFKN
jgi:hypothetical protein